ncbi:MAG: DUF1801 domain-containing protein [Nitrospira sp.]
MNRQRTIAKTVDAYIGDFPVSVQTSLRKMRATIKRAAPGAEETTSYGIPTLKLHSPLIYFAGFKTHIGLYPMTAALRRQFPKELSRYLSGKAAAKFPLDKPIPYDLIGRIVKFRVMENLKKRTT